MMKIAVSFLCRSDPISLVPFWDNPDKKLFVQHGKVFDSCDPEWRNYAKHLIEDRLGVVRVFINRRLVWSPTMGVDKDVDTFQPVCDEVLEQYCKHNH